MWMLVMVIGVSVVYALRIYSCLLKGEWVEGVVEGGDVDGGNGIKVSNLLSTKVSRFFLSAKVSRVFFFAYERQLPSFSLQIRGRDRMGGRTGYPVDSRR